MASALFWAYVPVKSEGTDDFSAYSGGTPGTQTSMDIEFSPPVSGELLLLTSANLCYLG